MNDGTKNNFKALEIEITSGRPFSVPMFLKEWLSKPRKLFIGGKWMESTAGGLFPTINPATTEKLSDIHAAGSTEVDLAVASAREAFDRGPWAKMGLRERSGYLKRIADRILEHRAPLAVLESLNTGKPIRESFDGDILRAAENFNFFSEFALHEESISFPGPVDTHFAIREPLGVVALITPWNLPLYLETWKLAPALMMGDSCVLKPSELTPLTASYFAELVEDILPPGVFNLIQGFGENAAGEFLCGHSGVDAISFTGETSTGRAIMKKASVGPTRVSFELGGKGANIVFADASFETALETSLRAAFRNQGEICLALPRVFVAKEKYEEFVDEFVKRAKNLLVGSPLDYRTEMGALISEGHYQKVMGYIQKVTAPAKILCGGQRPEGLDRGYFLRPTVITGLSQEHPISCEEVFGPVVSIYPFSSEDEVIPLANETPYGLSASVWTSDLNRANRVARHLRSGLVWVNCWFARDLRVPFGGQKRSGVGREGGKHSLDFFSEWKSICIRTEG